jgi:hypothetical protein
MSASPSTAEIHRVRHPCGVRAVRLNHGIFPIYLRPIGLAAGQRVKTGTLNPDSSEVKTSLIQTGVSLMTTLTKTQTCQIKCINKTDRFNPHKRITHVGGFTDRLWKITQQGAITLIEIEEWKFWVKPPSADSVWVVVALSRYGNKYLKTQSDGEEPNNLLSLPECP